MSAEHTFSRRDAFKAAGLTLATLPFRQTSEHVRAAEGSNEGTFFQSEFYPYSLTHPQEWIHAESSWGNDDDNSHYDIDLFNYQPLTYGQPAGMTLFARPIDEVSNIEEYPYEVIENLKKFHKFDHPQIAPHYENRGLFNFTCDTTQKVDGIEAITLEGQIPYTVIEGEDTQLIIKLFTTKNYLWEIDFYTPEEPTIYSHEKIKFLETLNTLTLED